MFVCKNIVTRTALWRRILQNNACVNNLVPQYQSYSGLVQIQNKYLFNHQHRTSTCIALLSPPHRKWCSRGLLDGDISGFSVQQGKAIKNVTELFPNPRVALYEISSRTPSKMYDVQYKQNTVAPKGRKKKTVQPIDWTCTYALVWPEKMKFESTAISKRQAADKAALLALQWLYINKRIDNKGNPIYDKNVLNEIKSTLNEPIQLSISDKSEELIEKIWNDYQSGIKDIYDATFKESKHKIITTPAVLTKDSTIDEDDYSDKEEDLDTLGDISELKQHVHPVYGKNVKTPSKATLDRRDRVLRQKFLAYDEELTPLPIDDYRDIITSTLDTSRVAVIVGAAGCGKSTRAPAAILKHCGARSTAIVSEPRRVAAIGLAERVAKELGEEVGLTVGYQVRLHSKPPKPPGGSILYCTSGVLLRRLQTNPGLEGCTHVIIDEAHERDVNTDITLLLLKRALDINPLLKILIMSATIDTQVFTKYFDSCPVIEVPGRTFPVEVSHLEDIQKKFNLTLPNTLENCRKEDGKPYVNCQEVAQVITAVDEHEKEGAILVFLPGWTEIKQTKQILDEQYKDSSIHMILPVHSRLSTADQTKMFSVPSPGIRKIVLATNVAETSITIPDVVHVIDTGSQKENRIKESTGTASLETAWVSLANAKQRTGRAGRVQPGHCYRMYTKEKEAEFAQHTTPEILRIPLEQTVLDCKSYAPNEKIAEFLSQLPEPPSNKAIEFAVKDLIEIGALTPQEQLTRLGGLLSSISLHPRIGVCLLHSAVVGDVVAVSNVAAHLSSNTEVFCNAPERRDEIREIKRSYNRTSDHAALYCIQEQFDEARQDGRPASDQFCERHGLKGERLAFISSLCNLHLEQLLKSGMIHPTTEAQELNRFSDIDELMCAVLMSGADSLLTTHRHVNTKGKMAAVTSVFTSTGDRAHIGSESVNHGITKRSNNKNHLLAYFGGHHSTERRALVVYKTSLIPPHTALIFSPGNIETETDPKNDGTTIMKLPKHRLKIHVPTSQATHLLKVREMFWNTIKYHIERDITSLDYKDNEKVSRFKVRLVKTLGRILVEGHREDVEGKARLSNVEELT
ncbi:ATP-dependent RNA helicase DHX30-like [Anticarsia gemmatalis]|uniref:ATP-dependent RNA helicase DHX30-like n=1 Tax=Anticarsia gemmatalis TaxID=129554 RepID=UPI003F761F78